MIVDALLWRVKKRSHPDKMARFDLRRTAMTAMHLLKNQIVRIKACSYGANQ
jgi:hypothetical protein